MFVDGYGCLMFWDVSLNVCLRFDFAELVCFRLCASFVLGLLNCLACIVHFNGYVWCWAFVCFAF